MEVERQWLIKKEDIPFDLEKVCESSTEMTQVYLNFDPEVRLRKYENGPKFVLTIKTGMSEDGLERVEVEREITEDEYKALFNAKKGIAIEKKRCKVPDERYKQNGKNYIQEIDIFHGELEGFCVLEVEFPSRKEAEEYIAPAWAGKEVTSSIEYKNCYIAGCDEGTRKRLVRGNLINKSTEK